MDLNVRRRKVQSSRQHFSRFFCPLLALPARMNQTLHSHDDLHILLATHNALAKSFIQLIYIYCRHSSHPFFNRFNYYSSYYTNHYIYHLYRELTPEETRQKRWMWLGALMLRLLGRKIREKDDRRCRTLFMIFKCEEYKYSSRVLVLIFPFLKRINHHPILWIKNTQLR